LQNMASYYGHGEPDIMNGFDADDPKPIKGFEGLYLLVNNNDEVAKAYLYLMECLYSGVESIHSDQHWHIQAFGFAQRCCSSNC
jgi:hypothetical protein